MDESSGGEVTRALSPDPREARRTRAGKQRRRRPPILTEDALPRKFFEKRKRIRRARYKTLVVSASARHLPLRRGSGNAKMGGDVLKKGRWRGLRLFYVALEEGKTCSSTCLLKRLGLCNSADYAGLRFRVNAQFYKEVDRQIAALIEKYPQGIVVRAHVSGDFPSVEYVEFWAEMLRKYPALHVWGHTHDRGEMLELIDARLNRAFLDRVLVRASDSYALRHAAIAVYPLGSPRLYDGLVCPGALTKLPGGPGVKRRGDDPLGSCVTCGGCMNPRVKTIILPLTLNGLGYAEHQAVGRQASDIGAPPAPDVA